MTSQNLASSPGALFDWDGVIVDSSRQHQESWELLAVETHRKLPEHYFEHGFGRKNEWIIPNILRWTSDPSEVIRLSARKEVLYREIVAEQGLDALPGVRLFLDRLREAGVPCCIGSSTERENVVAALKTIGFEGMFDDLVTSEDVTQGKPHPDVFLLAAARIHRVPGICVVFEDAAAGIQAAHAAGMKVVGVATTHAPEFLKTRVHRVVHRLDELTLADLNALVFG